MARRAPTTKAHRLAALAQPCPRCGASTGEKCRRPRGEKARPHVARLPTDVED